MAMRMKGLPGLSRAIRSNVRAALKEDLGRGDLTAALVPAGQHAEARLICRDRAVICGQPWCEEVFRQLDAAIHCRWLAPEGAAVEPGALICEVTGPARPILSGERTALNFLQTLSGVATLTRRYVDAVASTGARVLDTRKTIPGLRLAEKYAVRLGGGSNHRIGLYDAVLVKENHIVAGGGITNTVREARRLSPGVLLEVEVETLQQASEAFAAGADRLLLDNFPPERLAEAVRLRNAQAPKTGLEASGGVTLANIGAIAATGVDFISVGDLTKNIHAIDLSLRFRFADN